MILDKLRSFTPLQTYLIGSAAAILASFFRNSIPPLYYVLVIIALFFVIWGIVKYFSKN